jgi:hypothetical protein
LKAKNQGSKAAIVTGYQLDGHVGFLARTRDLSLGTKWLSEARHSLPYRAVTKGGEFIPSLNGTVLN